MVEGYFGINSQNATLTLHPRLKGASGRIALREPATGRRIAYDYRADPDRLRLTLWTDHPAPATVALTLPNDWSGPQTVTVNGQPVTPQAGQDGEDRWLRISLPSGQKPAVVEVVKKG